MIPDDTIIALSSGALPSGIAVVRISGPAARSVVESLAGGVPAIRQASLRRIRDRHGATIDHGLVLFFEAPATVTGEDLAEIHLHGGRAVVAACLDAALTLPNVRLAEAGEFTRRAFENGRIDLTEAEGLADLLAAETEAQRVQAMVQAGGALRALYEGWMKRVVHARAMLEASFDFADEGDISDTITDAVRPSLRQLMAEIETHLAGAGRGEIVRHGFRIAIVGPPNAGKSSLLNALADREAAIVSAIPGTTRDIIEVSLDLRGIRVRLFDTAGLRETEDEIERIGISRALETAGQADLILQLVPSDVIHVKQSPAQPIAELIRRRSDQTETPVWQIATKADLLPRRFEPETSLSGTDIRLIVSAKTGQGLPELVAAIAAAAQHAAGDPSALVPIRLRQRDLVATALSRLADIDEHRDPAEIVAEKLRQVTDALGSLTGTVGVEDLLDVIFSEFCIGK